MDTFFRCGPFSATSKDKRLLFENAEICLPDSIFALLSGPSGCGKTTLLKMAAGLNHAPGGRRELAGRIFTSDMLPRWRSLVLLMMQDAPVLAGDVETNLRFPFRFENAGSRCFDPDHARSLMKRAGLGHIAMDHDAAQLSGGERHRLALARAMLWSPDVILADEPLSGLDSRNASRCMDMLSEFAHRPGKAVLCVMHETGYNSMADLSFKLDGGTLSSE